jgi:hypothetical protein
MGGRTRLRKQYNDELHDLQTASNNIYMCMPWVRTGCVACKGRIRNAHTT